MPKYYLYTFPKFTGMCDRPLLQIPSILTKAQEVSFEQFLSFTVLIGCIILAVPITIQEYHLRLSGTT